MKYTNKWSIPTLLYSVARDNPLYVDPSTVVEEGVDAPIENGVSETTPLESGEV